MLVAACGTHASTTDPTGPSQASNGATNSDNGKGKTLVSPENVEKVKIVNQPGVVVSMDEVLVPGSVTVIEFYADWCGACKIIEKKLLTHIDDEPRIVLRKINIDDDQSAVAKKYDVGALPHVRIFDGKGKLTHVLVGNSATKAGPLARQLLTRK